MTTPFNPALAAQLLTKRIDDHNNLSRTIRFAVLDAVNPDPNVCIEDNLDPGECAALIFRRTGSRALDRL
jgi:hypothetical protein